MIFASPRSLISRGAVSSPGTAHPSGDFTEIGPQEAEHRGRIRPVIGQTFPLERAVDAYAAIEARDVIGKTLPLV
jgi:Zinc-binding dehydrogenase